MGRLTADPEMRYTQTNTGVARFTLAVDKRQKTQDGKREADFFNCTAFQQTAEFANKYFKKGQQVLIEGRLNNNNWVDKDGTKRYSTDIIIDQCYFADSKRSDSETSNYAPRQENSASVANGADAGGAYGLSEDDEDLPF